jgi:predicted 3-demethylubiquinone-9 3-methyltransferase (glyoxalase superfamily)
MSNIIVPCLWLDHQAEQAASFYTKLFPGGRISAVSHYPESADNPSRKPRGSVLTVEFEIAGQRFTALNGGPMFTINPSISLFVQLPSAAEVDRIYAALADGGSALMPLGEYPWSKRYGWVRDRYGVSFQLIHHAESTATVIAPCLMFTGAQCGKAEQAIGAYTRAFPGSSVERIERYAPGEGPVENVKHARFTLSGQPLFAMDGHGPHDFQFNEGLSLQAMCQDQREIDHFWGALSEGGEPGPCGWLKDRFGLSWQVVPKQITSWMTSADTAAKDRAFGAVMTMKKLDIAAIDRAFRGA